jgi:RNA 3'-terminal phosphate cyclase (ATP)
MSALVIDGSRGEGGGQILRTSLALAAVTGRAIELEAIRAKRAKPGLRQQHLTCVLAAAAICDAEVDGAAIGSQRLRFRPGALRGGAFDFDIGTAGSTGLVLQTVVPALLRAPSPSTVAVRGGTHNPMAPCFDFLDRVFAPAIRGLGAAIELAIEHHGFYPAGGGRVVATIAPAPLSPAAAIVDRGAIVRRRATAILARLPDHVADRELAVVQRRLGFAADECERRVVSAHSPGNALVIEFEHASGRELITGFGERGVRAERVAELACDEADAYLATGAPVGAHLADQLLLPMALAGGGRYRTGPMSLHSTTNIDTIRMFLDLPIASAGTDVVDVVLGAT